MTVEIKPHQKERLEKVAALTAAQIECAKSLQATHFHGDNRNELTVQILNALAINYGTATDAASRS